jgi:hypothetical protein
LAFNKFIGLGSLLVVTAAITGPLLAVNMEAQEGAERIHASAVEMNAAYEKLSTDTEFAAVSDKLSLGEGYSFVSTKDTIVSNLVGGEFLGPVYELLPGTKALIVAADEADRISKLYVDERVNEKIAAQAEAQNLCSKLEGNSVSVLLSSDENREFLETGNIADNLSDYLEYCDATGVDFEVASSTTAAE